MEYNNAKCAVITGGNSGIGLALTKKLLDSGYQVTITSRSGKVEDFTHPQLNVISLDLLDPKSIEAASQALHQTVKQIDLFVNNAGIADDIQLEIPTYETFKATIDVNLTGLMYFAESNLDLLSKDGHIVNISSEMGLLDHALPNATAYRISKAGLNMYSKILFLRYETTAVKVTAIHPGWVSTKLGGPHAPVTPEMAANGIFEVIATTKRSGEFRNIFNGDNFLL